MSSTQHCGNGSIPLKGPDLFENVDENVRAKLPENSTVVKISYPEGRDPEDDPDFPFTGFSGKIKVTENGTEKEFFLKVVKGDIGRAVVRGEFESNTLLYSKAPDFVPKPYAWGTYKSFPEYHFFLSEDLTLKPLKEGNPRAFTQALANLHKEESPSGKYGYPTSAHLGLLTSDSVMCDTWHEFFQQDMARLIAHEKRVHDSDDEFNQISTILCDTVIPELLKPMEDSDFNRPVLVHGNLRNGCCRFEEGTERAIAVAAAAFWAPREYDLALSGDNDDDDNEDDDEEGLIHDYCSIEKSSLSDDDEISYRFKLYIIHSNLYYSIFSHRVGWCAGVTDDAEKLLEYCGFYFDLEAKKWKETDERKERKEKEKEKEKA